MMVGILAVGLLIMKAFSDHHHIEQINDRLKLRNQERMEKQKSLR